MILTGSMSCFLFLPQASGMLLAQINMTDYWPLHQKHHVQVVLYIMKNCYYTAWPCLTLACTLTLVHLDKQRRHYIIKNWNQINLHNILQWPSPPTNFQICQKWTSMFKAGIVKVRKSIATYMQSPVFSRSSRMTKIPSMCSVKSRIYNFATLHMNWS